MKLRADNTILPMLLVIYGFLLVSTVSLQILEQGPAHFVALCIREKSNTSCLHDIAKFIFSGLFTREISLLLQRPAVMRCQRTAFLYPALNEQILLMRY